MAASCGVLVHTRVRPSWEWVNSSGIFGNYNPALIIRASTGIGQCITWANRVPYMLDHPIMASHITEIYEKGQYTFQVIEDGSLIQIFYQYDLHGDNLLSARLAFYRASTDEKIVALANAIEETQDNEMLPSLEIEIVNNEFTTDVFGEELEPKILKDGLISWLRIEYEPSAARGVLHHDCHMHFSAFPYSRFVVANIPTPAQFIEFVMSFCYPEVYKAHRLNEQGQFGNPAKIASVNATCFPEMESNVFSQIAHFRVPVTLEGRRR